MTFTYDLITLICHAMEVLGWWTVLAIVVGFPLAVTMRTMNEDNDVQR